MAFSVHWLTLTCTRKPLCPLLSPVYAFTLFKAQRYLSILCSTCLSSTLLVSHPFTFLCFTPPTAPLPPSLHPSLSSHFTSSCQSPLLSPPLHPLMIAEHISSDTKTKGWVHMWFLCESRVIWNINVGIIWLSGKGGERGVGGFLITSDCRFRPPKDGEAVRMDWGTVKITKTECLLLAAMAYFCLGV